MQAIIWISATCFLLSSAFLMPGTALAQQDCEAALIQDRGQLDLREASSLALAELYKRSRDHDSNWAAGISVPIKGVPLTGNAQSAESTREAYFQQSSLDWDSERLVSVATQTLSANAVEAYRNCIHGQHKIGPRILVYDATPEEATVEVRWVSAAGAPTTATGASIAISGGTIGPAFPTSWQTGEARTYFVRRNPGEDVRISTDIGLQTDSVFVSRIPEAPTKQPVLIMASCIGKGAFNDFRLWGPLGESCNGLPERPWGSYSDNARSFTQLGSCVGPGGSVSGLTFWGPVGEPCLQPSGVYGNFSNPVNISTTGIASCVGHGNFWAGHHNWGPAGRDCFGIPDWGKFDMNRVVTNASE